MFRSAARCERPSKAIRTRHGAPRCRPTRSPPTARRAPAVQHADDLQRDRGLQRPAAAPRLPAAHDPLPAPRPRADRRLRGDLADAGLPHDGAEPSPDLNADYLRYVAAQPGPKIAVGQDLDDPPGLGAQFGEVNATIHKKLGCVGHITDGCPRDLDEVDALGFQLFGLNPCVSHAYVRLVDFGKPVKLAGVEIQPGDLIHADKHGVCIIPLDIAHAGRGLPEVEGLERPLLEICRSDDFDLEEYIGSASAMKAKIRE